MFQLTFRAHWRSFIDIRNQQNINPDSKMFLYAYPCRTFALQQISCVSYVTLGMGRSTSPPDIIIHPIVFIVLSFKKMSDPWNSCSALLMDCVLSCFCATSAIYFSFSEGKYTFYVKFPKQVNHIVSSAFEFLLLQLLASNNSNFLFVMFLFTINSNSWSWGWPIQFKNV